MRQDLSIGKQNIHHFYKDVDGSVVVVDENNDSFFEMDDINIMSDEMFSNIDSTEHYYIIAREAGILYGENECMHEIQTFEYIHTTRFIDDIFIDYVNDLKIGTYDLANNADWYEFMITESEIMYIKWIQTDTKTTRIITNYNSDKLVEIFGLNTVGKCYEKFIK